MINFITQYWWQITLGIIGIVVLIVGIVYRKELVFKIKQETISFTALIISLSLTIIGFITKPKTEVVQLATIGGRSVNLFLPITAILVILTLVFLIVFFRKELAKDIDLG